MNSVAIMQPTYLPWAGYFNLIANVNHFVFLDNVKIEKQSWQVRNRVINNRTEHTITLAIKGSRNQLMKDVLLNDDTPWRKKHNKLLLHNYSKHSHQEVITNIVSSIINDKSITSLCELNSRIIIHISKELKFSPIFHYASELNSTGQRSQKLIEICKELRCTHYTSPIGSKNYIEQDGVFNNSEVTINYQKFTPPVYSQQGITNFIPYLSIIDMVANIGYKETAKLIR